MEDNKINNNYQCIRFQNKTSETQTIESSQTNSNILVETTEKINWGQLEVGDIVLLENQNYVPADLLILDMWDKTCVVKTQTIDDQTTQVYKYSPLLTQISRSSSIKGNIIEYRRLLTGRIEFKKTREIENIKGFIKLKKDPVSERISVQNILQKYSQINFTDWVIGIVLLNGNDSYSFNGNSSFKKYQRRLHFSFIEKFWNRLQIVFLVLLCFFIFIVIILRVSLVCFQYLPFKGQIIPIILDFFVCYPLQFWNFVDLFQCIYSLYINFQYKKNNLMNPQIKEQKLESKQKSQESTARKNNNKLNNSDLQKKSIYQQSSISKQEEALKQSSEEKKTQLNDQFPFKLNNFQLINDLVLAKYCVFNSLDIQKEEQEKQIRSLFIPKSNSCFQFDDNQSNILDNKNQASGLPLQISMDCKRSSVMLNEEKLKSLNNIQNQQIANEPVSNNSVISNKNKHKTTIKLKSKFLTNKNDSVEIKDNNDLKNGQIFSENYIEIEEGDQQNNNINQQNRSIPFKTIFTLQKKLQNFDDFSFDNSNKQKSESVGTNKICQSDTKQQNNSKRHSIQTQNSFLPQQRKKNISDNSNISNLLQSSQRQDLIKKSNLLSENYINMRSKNISSSEVMKKQLQFSTFLQNKDPSLKELILAICLCHDSKTKTNLQKKTKKITQQHLNNDTKIFFKFIKQCDIINFVCSCIINEKLYYVIEDQETKKKQTIEIIQKFQFRKRPLFLIICKVNEDNLLFLQEYSQKIPFYIDSAAFSEQKLTLQIEKGEELVFFSQKKITRGLLEDLQNQMKLENFSQDKIENYLIQVLSIQKCSLLGIFSLQKFKNPQILNLIQQVTQFNKKIWFLSSDSAFNLIQMCYSYQIITQKSDLVDLSTSNQEELYYFIRNQLHKLKKSFKKAQQGNQEEFTQTIFISGDSLNIIRKDAYLFNHFCLIVFYAKSLVGCDLDSQQKNFLISIINSKFKLQFQVCNILSSLNDQERVQQDSVNIYIQEKNQISPFGTIISQFCDVWLSNEKYFVDFIVSESRFQYEVLQEIVYQALYRAYLFAFMVFLWNLMSCVCNVPLISPLESFFLNNLFFGIVLIYKICNKFHKFKKEMKEEKSKLVYNYINAHLQEKKLALLGLNFQILINVIIDGIIIFVFLGKNFIFEDWEGNSLYVNKVMLLLGLYMISVIKIFEDLYIDFGWSFAFFTLSGFLGIILFMYNNEFEAWGQQYKQLVFFNCLGAICFWSGKIYLQQFFIKENNFVFVIGFIEFFQGIIEQLKGIQNQQLQLKNIVKNIFLNNEKDSIINSILMSEDINIKQIEMKKFFLIFKSNEIELKYKVHLEQIIQNTNTFYYIAYFIFFDIGYDLILLSSGQNQFFDTQYIIGYSICSSFLLILASMSITKFYKSKNIQYISIALVFIRTVKFFLVVFLRKNYVYSSEIIMHIIVSSSCFRLQHYNLLLQGIVLFLIFILSWEVAISYENIFEVLNQMGYSESFNWIVRFEMYFSVVFILCFYIKIKYDISSTLRNTYIQEHNLFKSTRKIKDMLSILLPKFIRDKIENMKQGEYQIQESQNEVTIVFCDIANFDDIMFHEKINTVKILDKIYRQFDISCRQNGLQKIETVGKTYMAAGGITDVEKILKSEGKFINVIPQKRALKFAFDIQKIIEQSQQLTRNKQITIKIGIHQGPAIAGVIGYHKPQFSLIGDTINTTSRVCSTGEYDKITISEEIYKNVHQMSEYKFIQKIVEAKGKGNLITYQAFLKKELNRNLINKAIQIQKKATNQWDELIRKISDSKQQLEKQQKFQKQITQQHRPSANYQIKLDSYQENLIQNTYHSNQQSNNSNEQNQFLNSNDYLPSMIKKKSVENPANIYNQSILLANNSQIQRKQKGISSLTVVGSRNSKFIQNNIPEDKSKIIENLKNQQLQDRNRNLFLISLQEELKQNIYLEDEKIQIKQTKVKFNQINNQNDKKLLFIQQRRKSQFFSKIKNRFTFNMDSFQDQEQQEFMMSIINQKKGLIMAYLLILSVYFFIKLILFISHILFFSPSASKPIDSSIIPQIIIWISFQSILLLILFLGFKRMIKNKLYIQKTIIVCLYLILQVITLVSQIYIYLLTFLEEKDFILPIHVQFCVEIVIIFNIFSQFPCLLTVHKIILYFFSIVSYIVYSQVTDSSFQLQLFYFIFFSCILHIRLENYAIENERKNYNNLRSLEIKKEQLDQLLQNLLPSHILEQFVNQMNKELPIFCEVLENATLLFADIAGFTKFSSQKEPIKVVNMLRQLFTDFDNHCVQQNVFKLYTIGDCYVCFGITDKNQRNPGQEAKNVVLFGFDMIKIIEGVRQHINCELEMRIGIHTGTIYGGIVGTEIVRYDVYGLDVLIANKIESHGNNGRVMVSEVTKKLLEDSNINLFSYEYKETIQIKQTNDQIQGFLVNLGNGNQEQLMSEIITDNQQNNQDNLR